MTRLRFVVPLFAFVALGMMAGPALADGSSPPSPVPEPSAIIAFVGLAPWAWSACFGNGESGAVERVQYALNEIKMASRVRGSFSFGDLNLSDTVAGFSGVSGRRV